MTDLPIGMDDAAQQLGCSKRTLTRILIRHPHYSRAGRRNVFYPADIESLKAAIREETLCRVEEKTRSASTCGKKRGGSTSPLKGDTGFEKVLEHLTTLERKKSPKHGMRKSGAGGSRVIALPSRSPRP